MSALRTFWNVLPRPRASPADQQAFDDALAKLEKVVKFIARMKADIEALQVSLRGMLPANPGGFALTFTKYENALRDLKSQAENTLQRVEGIRKQLVPKGVDTSRFNPLVQQVEGFKDFAVLWLEPDPLSKFRP